ncbi:MAG: hypothetical protein ACK4LA_03525 [Aquificaceae bacterium]
MEIRRIEGVLLQHAIEQSQPLAVEKSASHLRIKVLSAVPEVLLELFSENKGTVKARVNYSEGSMVSLSFSEGLEIKAENRSSVPFMPGDIVELTLESENPFTLKITSLFRGTSLDHLLKAIFEGKEEPIIQLNLENIKDTIENSGIFYERKLFDFLLEKVKPEDLLKDLKAQLLDSLAKDIRSLAKTFNIDQDLTKNIKTLKDFIESLKDKNIRDKEHLALVDRLQSNLYRLELLSQVQWFMLRRGNLFFLPFKYQEGSGGIMFKVEDSYTVIFKLNYQSGFIAGFLKRPKAKSLLEVKISTNMISLAEELRKGKEILKNMLLEEGIELKSYAVEVLEEEAVLQEIKSNLSEEGFLLLA